MENNQPSCFNHILNSAINVISFNMHGFNQGVLELKTLCDISKFEVIFLQEHWLSSDLMFNFDYFKNNYCVFGISAMDSTLSQGILRGRPKGGVCSLIKKSFCNSFNSVSCISCKERYTIISLDNLLLINVYLPSCRNEHDIDSLRSILSCICCDIEGLKSTFIIFGGILIVTLCNLLVHQRSLMTA